MYYLILSQGQGRSPRSFADEVNHAGEAKKLGQKKRLRTLKDLDKSVLARYEEDFQDEMVVQYGRVRRFLPKLLCDIEFKAAPAGKVTLEAHQYLAGLLESRKQLLEDAPEDIISNPWKRLVFDKERRAIRQGYTLCFLDKLQDSLRRRDVYVKNSDRWGVIEQHARNNHYTALQRYELRLQQAKPILEELKIWLDKTIKTTSTQSELGKALEYMHLRWGELTTYLLDGCLEIDNNLIENLIRPFALGRKNWLMAGSQSPRRSCRSIVL